MSPADAVMGECVRVFKDQEDLGYGTYMGEILAPSDIRKRALQELSESEVLELKVPKVHLDSGQIIYIYGEEYRIEPLGDRHTSIH